MTRGKSRRAGLAALAFALAALLSPGCTNLIAAKARPTANFPRTWDESMSGLGLAQPLPPPPPAVQASPQPPPPVQPSQPPGVQARPAYALSGLLAVLDFKNRLRGPEAEQVDAPYFANVVRATCKRQAPGLKIMTRENVLVLLQASGKRLEDCEGECEVDTARRLGADYVLSGDLLKVGQSFKLDLRLHETKDGQLLSGTTISGKTVDELDAGTTQAVSELLASVK